MLSPFRAVRPRLLRHGGSFGATSLSTRGTARTSTASLATRTSSMIVPSPIVEPSSSSVRRGVVRHAASSSSSSSSLVVGATTNLRVFSSSSVRGDAPRRRDGVRSRDDRRHRGKSTREVEEFVASPPGALDWSDYRKRLHGMLHSCRSRRDAERCERVLRRAFEERRWRSERRRRRGSSSSGEGVIRVTALNVALDAWARARRPHRADALLRFAQREVAVEKERGDDATSCRPDLVSHNTVIKAYSAVGDAAACRRLLTELLEASASDPSLRPDQFTFSTVLRSHARCDDPDAGARAEEVLETMERALSVVPDVVSLTAAMSVYARAGGRDGALRAQRLLERALERGAPVPDDACWTVAIHAWARAAADDDGAAARVDALLARRREAPGPVPDGPLWTAALDAHADAGDLGRATELLGEMLRETTHDPRAGFEAVVRAAGRAGATDRAEELVTIMREGGVPLRAPAYAARITALARSKGRPDRCVEARAVLAEMVREHDEHDGGDGPPPGRPNAVVFSTVVTCCAHYDDDSPERRAEAFRVAQETFDALDERRDEFGGPDNVMYNAMVRAVGKLLRDDPKQRDLELKRVFDRCCRDGRLSPLVWKELLFHMGEERVIRMVRKRLPPPTNDHDSSSSSTTPPEILRHQHLPPEWSRNSQKKPWSDGDGRTSRRRDGRKPRRIETRA